MTTKQKPKADNPEVTDALQQLVKKARQGDRTILPELRKALDEDPHLWQTVGDLAKHAEATWIGLVARGDLFIRESIRRDLERRRKELAGEDPTPLERHLVDRIVACWLALQHAEMMAASTSEGTLPRREHYLKRLDAAERRHTAAVNQLNKVRELLPRKRRPVANEVVEPKKRADHNGHDKTVVAPPRTNGNRMNVFLGDRELVGATRN